MERQYATARWLEHLKHNLLKLSLIEDQTARLGYERKWSHGSGSLNESLKLIGQDDQVDSATRKAAFAALNRHVA
jgi:hypothetical protein